MALPTAWPIIVCALWTDQVKPCGGGRQSSSSWA